jgi:hypothetical protein
MSASGTREFLDRWAPAAEWGVALGTGLLAIATAYLARKARDEAKAVRADADAVSRSVVLQEQQIAAALWPNVYPVAPVDWVNRQGRWAEFGDRLIVLKNAGPGVALNVRGKAFLAPGGVGPYTREIVAGTIAPGEDVDVRVTPFATAVWANAEKDS